MDPIPATFEHGVFRPMAPVSLPDGCQVELSIVPAAESASAPTTGSSTAGGSIEDQLRQLADELPATEWQRLPADLSDRIDHYVYQNKPE
jgi:predicted DNA-binding antitoxin AbrB/MazE fold protein